MELPGRLFRFGVRTGTPFAGYLRALRVVVASTVEKGGPLAPSAAMSIELVRIRTAQQYPMLMPTLFPGDLATREKPYVTLASMWTAFGNLKHNMSPAIDGDAFASASRTSSSHAPPTVAVPAASAAVFFFFFFFFFHLTYSRWTSSLPSCLRSQSIFPSLPSSRLTFFLSRCKFSTLTTRQPMIEFYLLTFPRFPLRTKEHRFYFGKNRTHDFRTSRCAAYLLDHSGDVSQRKYSRPTRPSHTVSNVSHAHSRRDPFRVDYGLWLFDDKDYDIVCTVTNHMLNTNMSLWTPLLTEDARRQACIQYSGRFVIAAR